MLLWAAHAEAPTPLIGEAHRQRPPHADLLEGERILKDLFYECQQSLEGIKHAKLDLDARGWARARGLRD